MTKSHQPYQTIISYKVSLTIPDDETTEVIIKTKSAGVCFASSPQDALQQTKTGNQYSKQSYASYIMNYVRENLCNVDVDDTNLTYTKEPTIKLMTQAPLVLLSLIIIKRLYQLKKNLNILNLILH